MNENRDSIMRMARGAFEERVDYEMDKVIQNILDPNTKATAKRKITPTIELTPPTPGTGHTGPPARRPTTSREGAGAVDKVGIFQKIRELFDEAPKRMCDETGRAELERELEEGINRDITIMLGYQPPILIKPVIALNKEARSAVLEELKIVPTSTDYIAITVNMEGGADHE